MTVIKNNIYDRFVKKWNTSKGNYLFEDKDTCS